MNKKKWLILTALSLLAITGSIGTAMALNHTKINVSKAEKTIYTMVVDINNCALISPGNLYSITANGNKVKFQYPSSADYGSMPENAFLRIKSNNSYFYVSKEADVYHAITGIESIKVNYVRCPDYVNSPKVTEEGQTGDFTIEYGYVDINSGNLRYDGSQNITNNVEADLSAISPRYFRLTKKYNSSSGFGALLLQSVTIKYTCDENRTDDEVMKDVILSSFSKDPVVDIYTNTVTYGMYPQSLASNQEDLENEYTTYAPTPISSLGENYYFINGHLYARKLAESTGYNDEYVVGEPYWFNVEPVEWYRQTNIGTTGHTDMLLFSKKILTSRVFANQKNVVRYGGDSEDHSPMRDFLEGEFKNQLLPSYFNNNITGTTKSSGSVVISGNNRTGYDALSNCTIFPVSEAELKSTSYLGRSFVDNNYSSDTRRFEVTAYARSFVFSSSSTTPFSMKNDVISAIFWMRSSYTYNGFCSASGQPGCNFGNSTNDKYGVLPAMTIRIEN